MVATAFFTAGAADSSLPNPPKEGKENAGLAGAATGAAVFLRESSGLMRGREIDRWRRSETVCKTKKYAMCNRAESIERWAMKEDECNRDLLVEEILKALHC